MKNILTNKLKLKEIKHLYWDKQHNLNEIANRLNISFWELYSFINKHKLNLRNRSQAAYLTYKFKPQFLIKNNLTIYEEKLKIAGIMLYWAEGTLRGNTVDFTNSNPDMVRVFLEFLRKICGINEGRLKLYLYAYSYHKLEEIKKYWSKITGIKIEQFTKPYIKKGALNSKNRKLPYGLVHIRYNDKKLLKIIENWIINYRQNVLWAGTQVAKGDRLCKRSVLSKERMEK